MGPTCTSGKGLSPPLKASHEFLVADMAPSETLTFSCRSPLAQIVTFLEILEHKKLRLNSTYIKLSKFISEKNNEEYIEFYPYFKVIPSMYF